MGDNKQKEIIPFQFVEEEEYIPADRTTPFKFLPYTPFIPVDLYVPEGPDMLIQARNKGLLIPVSQVFQANNLSFDYFSLEVKRAYYSQKMKDHFVRYLNYFEKFYDYNHLLIWGYAKMKYTMDNYPEAYSLDDLFADIKRYILSGEVLLASQYMNEDNYITNLKHVSSPNSVLQYTDKHVKAMFHVSLLTKFCIPLLTHWLKIHPVEKKMVSARNNEVMIRLYIILTNMYKDSMDLYSKMYETAQSNVNVDSKNNAALWAKQDIRGKNKELHAEDGVNLLITLISPKYVYNQNPVCFNHTSMQEHTKYQVANIRYEYSFNPLSSSERDADNNSEMDKYESNLIKQPAYVYLITKAGCQLTTDKIELTYGPFTMPEITFQLNEMQSNGYYVINSLQKKLVCNLWMKEFGDANIMQSINQLNYIVLILAAKRMLMAHGLVIFPYLLSSKFVSVVKKKTLNKREREKILANPLWEDIKANYANPKVLDDIMKIACVLLASDFRIIDFDNPELNGRTLNLDSDIFCDEMLKYVLICSRK